jgi:hypothetical protein
MAGAFCEGAEEEVYHAGLCFSDDACFFVDASRGKRNFMSPDFFLPSN